jgi:hypothetical protein
MICMYVFLLRQKYFNMILVNNPYFYDGVLQHEPNMNIFFKKNLLCYILNILIQHYECTI